VPPQVRFVGSHDLDEMASTDQDYRALTRFFREAHRYEWDGDRVRYLTLRLLCGDGGGETV
jgi:hypothetical protein